MVKVTRLYEDDLRRSAAREDKLRNKLLELSHQIGQLEWVVRDLRIEVTKRDVHIAELQAMIQRAHGAE